VDEQPRRAATANGTEERLDDLIDEIKGLRADLARQQPAPPPEGQVELREPRRDQRGRRS
jgi:hypothetical protein